LKNKLEKNGLLNNRNMPGVKDIIAVGRILISAALLILAQKLNVPTAVSIIIMILAMFVSGIEAITESAAAIKKKDFFNGSILILLSAVIAFCFGCFKESVLLVMLYQLGRTLMNYALTRTKSSFTECFADEDSDEAVALKSIIGQPDSGLTDVEKKCRPIFNALIRAAVTVGVIYALVFPLVMKDMSFTMSVRRGLMLITAAAPLSALISLPLCAFTCISGSAAYNVFIKNAEVLEKTAKVRTIVFDKAGVMTEGAPRLSRISSPVFDYETVLRIIAHMAYNSESSIAEPILAAYSGEIKPEQIEEFADIPGGMEMRINGIDICLGNTEIMDARGVALPKERIDGDLVLHLSVGGKYAGHVVFNENIDPYAETLISDLMSSCGVKSVLVSGDGKELTAKNAADIGISEFYYECDGMKKLELVSRCGDSLEPDENLMYVTASSLDFHTAADIDAKVGHEADNADIMLTKRGVFALSAACRNSKRSVIIAKENLILTSLIKLILIVLALTGCATLWFVAFVDLAAGCAAILNTSRINAPIFEENLFKK